MKQWQLCSSSITYSGPGAPVPRPRRDLLRLPDLMDDPSVEHRQQDEGQEGVQDGAGPVDVVHLKRGSSTCFSNRSYDKKVTFVDLSPGNCCPNVSR